MTIETLLAGQRGLVSREQAVAAGVPPRVIDERVRLRRWTPVLPRVYRAGADGCCAAESAVRAALLWAGQGAVLTGLAAAWWHGLAADAPETVSVAVPRSRRPLRRPEVTLLGRRLLPDDVVEHRGVLVTVPALSLLDGAVELGGAGCALLAGAVAAGMSPTDVRAALERTSARAAAARLMRDLRHRGLADRARIGHSERSAGVLDRGRVADQRLAGASR